MGSVRLIRGDARAGLRSLPAGAFQTCVTSPPYFSLRSYLPDGHPDKAREIGAEESPDAYVDRLVKVFREVRRVLRPDGTLWLNLGDSYAGTNNGFTPSAPSNVRRAEAGSGTEGNFRFGPRLAERQPRRRPRGIPSGLKSRDLIGIPWLVAFALRADGWWLRSAIVWHKPNPMPESVRSRPTTAHEYVFLLAKAERYFYDAEAIAEPATMTPQRRGAIGGRGNAARDHGDGGFPMTRTVRDEPAQDGDGTRNARSVWTFPPGSFPGAHFATMPIPLAERCVRAGSSAAGQCPRCGAPWERVVERGESDYARLGGYGGMHFARPDSKPGAFGQTRRENGTVPSLRAAPILGETWRPSCACPAAPPVPQAVLDPFGGAGTSAIAALSLGRDCTLIELDPAAMALTRERLKGGPLPSPALAPVPEALAAE